MAPGPKNQTLCPSLLKFGKVLLRFKFFWFAQDVDPAEAAGLEGDRERSGDLRPAALHPAASQSRAPMEPLCSR